MNDEIDDEGVLIRPEDLGEPGATVLGLRGNGNEQSDD